MHSIAAWEALQVSNIRGIGKVSVSYPALPSVIDGVFQTIEERFGFFSHSGSFFGSVIHGQEQIVDRLLLNQVLTAQRKPTLTT